MTRLAIAGFHEGLAGQISVWVHLSLPSVDLVCFFLPSHTLPIRPPSTINSRASRRFAFPNRGTYRGLQIIVGNDWPQKLKSLGVTTVICALPDSLERESLIKKADSFDFDLPPIIHPSAVLLSDVLIGGGSIIEPLAYVGLGAEVGRCCQIHAGAQIDHNSVLEDYVTLNPRATVAGNTRIGKHSCINMGASISNSISVPAYTTVGAMAFVNKSYEKSGLRLFGCPAIPK